MPTDLSPASNNLGAEGAKVVAEADAAKLNAAAVSRKKKKKKQETACPLSVRGGAQSCTECKSIWCCSK